MTGFFRDPGVARLRDGNDTTLRERGASLSGRAARSRPKPG
jgi:hypothetical protein